MAFGPYETAGAARSDAEGHMPPAGSVTEKGQLSSATLRLLGSGLAGHGVELGQYDEQVAQWLARSCNYEAAQAIVGWISRAYEAGKDAAS